MSDVALPSSGVGSGLVEACALNGESNRIVAPGIAPLGATHAALATIRTLLLTRDIYLHPYR